MTTLDVVDVLALFDRYEARDSLSWRVGKDREVRFMVDCSDVFWWGCSDGELITGENWPHLSQAFHDVHASLQGDTLFAGLYGPQVFCARVRGMRPQGCVYPWDHTSIWALFDAAGPVREVGLGNPYPARSEVEVWRETTERALATVGLTMGELEAKVVSGHASNEERLTWVRFRPTPEAPS